MKVYIVVSNVKGGFTSSLRKFERQRPVDILRYRPRREGGSGLAQNSTVCAACRGAIRFISPPGQRNRQFLHRQKALFGDAIVQDLLCVVPLQVDDRKRPLLIGEAETVIVVELKVPICSRIDRQADRLPSEGSATYCFTGPVGRIEPARANRGIVSSVVGTVTFVPPSDPRRCPIVVPSSRWQIYLAIRRSLLEYRRNQQARSEEISIRGRPRGGIFGKLEPEAANKWNPCPVRLPCGRSIDTASVAIACSGTCGRLVRPRHCATHLPWAEKTRHSPPSPMPHSSPCSIPRVDEVATSAHGSETTGRTRQTGTSARTTPP